MKQHRKRAVLLCIPAILLIYICYLFLHDPGVPVNTWIPDENFNVSESDPDSPDSSVLLSLDIAPYKNPETIRLYDGWLYAAVEGGDIIRLRQDGSGLTSVLHTGGSILGFDITSDGTIWFCACDYEGIPSVCRFDGDTVVRLPIEGIAYPDAICADEENGLLYFSDASVLSPVTLSMNPQETYMIDMMAHTASGAIISYDLQTGIQRTIADGFCFANGLSLTSSKDALLVNETYGSHIWKIGLSDGTKELLLTVPGYPDNLHSAEEGYWSGLAGAYSFTYAGFSDHPLLRKAILNLPSSILSSGTSKDADVLFIRFDETGSVLEYRAVEDAGFTTTGIVETDDRLYFETISGIDKIYYLEKD